MLKGSHEYNVMQNCVSYFTPCKQSFLVVYVNQPVLSVHPYFCELNPSLTYVTILMKLYTVAVYHCRTFM